MRRVTDEAVAIDPLVTYLHDASYDTMPPRVTKLTQQIILDTVACIFGGGQTDVGGVQVKVAMRLAGGGPATVIGVRAGTDPVSAAHLNANLADILDYEDTTVEVLAHPSAVVVPVAMAAGEVMGASGRDLIAAVVVGYEVGLRIGRAILPSPARAMEVPVSGAWLGVGGAAAASRLMGLSRVATVNALGYAGVASPLPTWYTRWGRPVHWVKGNYGNQARAGMLGPLLAQEGFVGPQRLFEGEHGFWRIIGSDRFSVDDLSRDLWARYEILDAHLKPYPTCHFLHPVVEIVQGLARRHTISPDDVEEVVVSSFRYMTDWFDDPDPETLVDAEFSIPYAVAVALAGVPVGPAWYGAPTLRSPSIRELAGRVRTEASEEADAGFARGQYPTKVVIKTRSGASYAGTESIPMGAPSRPLGMGQLREKFMALVEPALGDRKAREVWEAGCHLAEIGDIRRWMTALVSGSRAARGG